MPMRQLRSCDFCGEEAAGVYEAVPPELSPTEAEQRRIVLCSDCLDTLEHTLKPLLARLGVDGGADGRNADTGPVRSESASTSQAAAAESEPPEDEGSSDDLDVDLAGDRQSGPPDGSDSPGGRIDSSDNGTDASAREPEAAATADGVDRLEDDGEAATGPSSGSVADPPSTTGSDPVVDDAPDEFRTVMRLLGNREFPVDRAEIVELAESAYELDAAHVERILDHAVDRDLILDDGETLRRA